MAAEIRVDTITSRSGINTLSFTGDGFSFLTNVGIGTTITADAVSPTNNAKLAVGIVTANYYYGDGSQLSNVISGVGIQSAGTLVGTGFTTLNFIGAGNTFAVNGTTVDISISGAITPTKIEVGNTKAEVTDTGSDGAFVVTTEGTGRLTVDSSGRTLLGGVTANANGGVLQLSSGITFPATQVAASDANTLDDYEEGTWTPDLRAGGSALLSSGFVAGDGPRAVYTKVGNCVTIWMNGRFNGLTAATGAVTIGGLPFTAADETSVGLVTKRETATTKVIGGFLSGTTISLRDQTGNVSNASPEITKSDFYDYARLSLCFQYKV